MESELPASASQEKGSERAGESQPEPDAEAPHTHDAATREDADAEAPREAMETERLLEGETDALLGTSSQPQSSSSDTAAAASKKRKADVLLGIVLILIVSVIWVAAADLVQVLNEDSGQKTPIFLTYVCVSEFIILLPIHGARRRWARDGVASCRRKKAAAGGGSSPAVEATFLIPPAPTVAWRETAKVALIIAPLWALAQGSYNYSLGGTSVSSSTILSTTSCIWTWGFTMILPVLRRLEGWAWSKALGVAITMGGAVAVALSDSSGSSGNGSDTTWGDLLACFSALMYGVYTVAIRLLVRPEAGVHMSPFFGCLGVATAVLFAPLIVILHVTGVEALGNVSWTYIGLVLVKGLFDNVLSDVLWAKSIHLTSATVATLGLSLTIPLAMASDGIFKGIKPAPLLVLGAFAVTVGFALSTVSLGAGSCRGAAARLRTACCGRRRGGAPKPAPVALAVVAQQ